MLRILVVSFLFKYASSMDEKLLHIGGIFPISGSVGWQGGQACQPAAMLALEDVNNHSYLLPGYRLNLVWNDSLCEPGLGAAVMYDLLYNPPQKLMLLGGCSTVSTTIGEAAKMWNLIVLSYGSSSPALSDRKRFPTFFRTHPSATLHNPTRVRLMKKFGWSRVAILQQAEEVFISTVEDLEIECKRAGIEVVTRQSFLNDPTDAVRSVKRQDARIIVGLYYVVAARRVLCEIFKNNLYGKSYVWFFIGWYEDGWYKNLLEEEGLTCTREEMTMAAEGHITTEALMWNQDNQKTISGMTADDFRKRLNGVLQRNGYDIAHQKYPEGYQEAPLAYDAVWSITLALNRTMQRLKEQGRSLEEFTYTNKEIADQLYEAMNATEFLGVSGRVAFKTDGSRIAWTQIEQMIDGKYRLLGYYDFMTENLTWFNQETWIGGKVPQDRTIIRSKLRTVSLILFISMCSISAIGIILAICLLIFTFMHRHRRYIQLSHPTCNNTSLVGIILCLSSICLLGLDGRFVSESQFPFICGGRAWLLCLGFSLAYGAMFSKVWRVHRLTTKTKSESKKVESWKLYLMVGCFLLIDVVILTTWQVVDPLQRTVEEFPLEVPENIVEDVKIKPQLEHCESKHNIIWLGIIYSYKGFLLIFGLFLSYETRSIKLKQMNDSRLVGMSIYNVVVLCVITAPVSLVISAQEDASFVFVALAIIFCCFLSMALVFIPKVVEVMGHPAEKVETTDNAPSKEEEERYQKLVRENDDIQRLIAEKEEKIRALKQKLQEKAAKKAREQTSENHVTVSDSANTTSSQALLRQGHQPSLQIPTLQSSHLVEMDSQSSISMEATSIIVFDRSEAFL